MIWLSSIISNCRNYHCIYIDLEYPLPQTTSAYVPQGRTQSPAVVTLHRSAFSWQSTWVLTNLSLTRYFVLVMHFVRSAADSMYQLDHRILSPGVVGWSR